MTREEKIALLVDELEDIRCNNFDADTDEDKTLKEAIRAIKTLKQQSILDKIRAEIEQLTITEGGDDYVRKMAELFSLKMKVLQIIDRYKAESEA